MRTTNKNATEKKLSLETFIFYLSIFLPKTRKQTKQSNIFKSVILLYKCPENCDETKKSIQSHKNVTGTVRPKKVLQNVRSSKTSSFFLGTTCSSITKLTTAEIRIDCHFTLSS